MSDELLRRIHNAQVNAAEQAVLDHVRSTGLLKHKDEIENPAPWPDPTPEMLESPEFNAIWNVIKSWDINVPDVYNGYCGASGNHVRAILDALNAIKG